MAPIRRRRDFFTADQVRELVMDPVPTADSDSEESETDSDEEDEPGPTRTLLRSFSLQYTNQKLLRVE